MASCDLKTGRKYCSLPGCNGSGDTKGTLFLIPTSTGKRYELSAKEWADKFHQIIFRYRCDAVFKRKVQSGRSFICAKHFTDKDIIKSDREANLRFGSLPTISLPKESHETTNISKRRMIEKHPLPEKRKPVLILSIDDVMEHWKSSQLRGWRMHQICDDSVHLTYYTRDILHAAPFVSVLITEKESALTFSVAYNGLYATDFSEKLNFETKSLRVMLQHILDAKLCSGYESIPDSSTGFSFIKLSYVQGDEVLLRKRFFSDNCLVAHSGIPSVCQECMASYAKCTGNLNCISKKKSTKEFLLRS